MSIRRIANPPNPYAATHVEWTDEAPPAPFEVYEETARSIVSKNDSVDVGFRFSVNPYRGCYHACAYCYARTTHEYLDWGAGTDFDRKIVVKVNAPELLRAALRKRSWKRDLISFSGVTDCYQPLEAAYSITKRCLEACLAEANPISIITKGQLVARDAELLASVNRASSAMVYMSIAFSNDEDSRRIEPYASPPSRRFAAMAKLHEHGVPLGVGVAPIILGLNDSQIPEILERAYEAGARRAFMVNLRLPGSVLPVWDERLGQAFPDRAAKIRHRIREIEHERRVRQRRSELSSRMSGLGPHWQIARRSFEVHARRLGIEFRDSPAHAQSGDVLPTQQPSTVIETRREPQKQLSLCLRGSS